MERCRDCYGKRRAEHSAKLRATATRGGEGGGGRNLNAPSTELRRTGQDAAKTELFEARAVRHYARQHAGLAGWNLTDLNLTVLWATYVCSENRSHKFALDTECVNGCQLIIPLSLC